MVKKRSINQKLEELSKGKLKVILSDWDVNELTNDFGLDFDVRICSAFSEKEQKVTHTSFYIQLKSTTEPCISEPYHDLDIDDLILFFNHAIPVILIKYYEKIDQFHWVIIQPYVWDILNKKDPRWSNKSQKRIKLPNKLDNLKNLEDQVLATQARISRYQVSNLGLGEGLCPADFEKFLQRGHKEIKLVSLGLASQKAIAEKFDDAKKLFEDVASSQGNDEYKLIAILNLILQSNSANTKEHPKILKLTRQGIELADMISAVSFLHLFKILRYQVQLNQIASRLSRVIYAKKYDIQHGDGTFSLFYQMNIDALDSIHKSLILSVTQSLHELIKGNHKSEFTLSLAIIIESITQQIQLLGFINPEIMQAAGKEREPLIQSFIEVLKTINDPNLLHIGYFDLCNYYYWSGNPNLAKEYLKKAEKIANDEGYVGYTDCCEQLFKMITERPNPLIVPESKESVENIPLSEAAEATRKHLEIMGFDFTYPDQMTSEHIIPALEELDPTEYLRFCEHFRVSYVSTSPLGQSIALPSLGGKVIWCKFKGGSMGFSLKNMIPHFQSTKCIHCKERKERAKTWTCTIHQFEALNNDPEFQKFIDSMMKAIYKT